MNFTLNQLQSINIQWTPPQAYRQPLLIFVWLTMSSGLLSNSYISNSVTTKDALIAKRRQGFAKRNSIWTPPFANNAYNEVIIWVCSGQPGLGAFNVFYPSILCAHT